MKDLQEHRDSWLAKRKLAKYVLYSALGPGLPMILALFTVPFLIHKLGVERYGLLSIAWLILGYFSLFDFGLGRAAVRMYAEKFSAGERESLHTIFFTTFYVTFAIGIVLGVVFGLSSDFFVGHFFKIDPALRAEAKGEIFCLAFAMPVIALTAVFRGFLEAEQKFAISNILQTIVGVLTYLGPVCIVLWRDSLVWIVGTMVGVRIVVFLGHFGMAYIGLPRIDSAAGVSGGPRRAPKFERAIFRGLVRMGSWVSVSNIVGPIMVYSDRLMIGSLVSLGAVAYYSTPYDLVTRLWVLTGALNQVLFPAFSSFARREPERSDELYRFGLRSVLVGLFPVLLVISCFALEGLHFWVGADFANKSHEILQIFCAGMFVNVIAQVTFVYLQGLDRADIPAKASLAELAFFLGGVWFAARTYGVIGVAVVWALRLALDFGLLQGGLASVRPELRGFLRSFVVRSVPLFAGLVVLAFPLPLAARVAAFVVLAVAYWFLWAQAFLRDLTRSGGWRKLLGR